MRFLERGLLAAVLGSSWAAASLQIVPGGTWTTSNGTHLQAHGPGILVEDGVYYLVGEDKTQGSAFQNINCYSSRNLVEWEYEGALLSRTAEDGDLGPSRVVERPKVLRNPRTGQYVLFLHIDSSNYGEAKVGIATSDSVCGRYAYQGSFRPLDHQSRDMGVYLDPDTQVGYLLSEDRQNGLRIMRLSDNFLSVESEVYLWDESIESPALVKRGGRYFMFGSHLTGWNANDNVYSTSTSLDGGWSAWQTFALVGSNTYTSQTSFVLPVGDGSGAYYLGDRWVPSNLGASTYVWLPLAISGDSASMDDLVSWVPDLAGASWSAAPAETQYEAEAAAYGGAARDVSCSGCSGGAAAGYIGGPDGGSVAFSGIRSDADGPTTIRVQFLNGDTAPRYANARVNGGPPQRLAFVRATGTPASSVLVAELRSGTDNEIVIEGLGDGSWGPDVDRLIVPVS